MFSQRQVLFVLITIAAWSAPTANAQDDDTLKLLREVPPELLTPETIESGIRTLNWRIKRDGMQAERIQQDIRHLNDKIRDREMQHVEIAKMRLGDLAFTTDAIREQLIGQVLKTLLDARIDIATTEALVERLTDDLDNLGPDAVVMRQIEVQEKALGKQLDLLNEKRQTLQAAHEAAIVSRDDVLDVQLRIEELRGKLAVIGFEKELKTKEGQADIARRLADLRLELHQLKAREDAAVMQMAQLADASRGSRELKQNQRRLDQLLQQLEVRQARLDKVLLQIQDAQVFLDQISTKPGEQ